MNSAVLPLRAITAIDGRAYEMTIRYSGAGTLQALWQDLWSLLEMAKTELHTFDDRYRIGPHPHRVEEKYGVLKGLCEKADPYLDWGRYPLEFPEGPVEEDIWFMRNVLNVLQKFYWMRELFMGEHSSISYMTSGHSICSVGWFFCLKDSMNHAEFMKQTAIWTEEMDDIQNGIRYDFKIVDEDHAVVESFSGCDDLEHLLIASHLDDLKFIPLLDKVRAEVFT